MSSRVTPMLLPTPLKMWSVQRRRGVGGGGGGMVVVVMEIMRWRLKVRCESASGTCVVGQLPLPHLRRRCAALGTFSRSSRLGVDKSINDAGNGCCCGGGGGSAPAHVVVALHSVAPDDASVVVNRDLHQPLYRICHGRHHASPCLPPPCFGPNGPLPSCRFR
jgi:hypothetical protein